MSKVSYVEVMVGELPAWYDEAEHDNLLESEVNAKVCRKFDEQDEEPEVRVTYSYNGPALIIAYNDEGDVVLEQEMNLEGIFALIQ